MDLKRLGKYEIVAKIGQGAMGQVHRAHDPILSRDVALKTMAAGVDTDDELRRRFHREAQSAARLNHPNIVTVYDFGEEQGHMYIAMELLEGADLKEVISRQRPLTLDAKLELMDQICDGLAFAHARGVIHRDLKPANLHLQADGKVKIVDFGLARISSAAELTGAGMMLGTPNYMSPEQVRGDKATTRSDVFSLGAVFYELLAGRKAFDADAMAGVLFQVMQKEPEPLDRVRAELQPVWVVLQRALLKDPARRFADAGEMREALREARRVVQADAHRARVAPRKPAPGDTPSAAGTLVRPVEPPRTSGTSQPALATSPTVATHAPDVTAATAVPTAIPTAVPTAVPAGIPAAAPRPPVPPTPAASDAATQTRAVGVTVATPAAAPTVALPASVPPQAPAVRKGGPARVSPAPAAALSSAPAVASASAPRSGLSVPVVLGAVPVVGVLLGVGLWLVLRDGPTSAPATPPSTVISEVTPSTLASQAPPSTVVATPPSTATAAEGVAPRTLPTEVPPRPLTLPNRASPTPRAAVPSPSPRATPTPAATAVAPPKAAVVPPTTLTTVVPTTVAVAPPPTAVPAATLPPPPTTAPPVIQSDTAARQAIRGVLDEYRAAFERRDADALRSVQPGVDYQAMRKTFASVTGYTVRVDVKEVSVTGNEGRAACVVTYLPQPKPAQKIPPQNTVFHLRRTGDVWLIERLERR